MDQPNRATIQHFWREMIEDSLNDSIQGGDPGRVEMIPPRDETQGVCERQWAFSVSLPQPAVSRSLCSKSMLTNRIGKFGQLREGRSRVQSPNLLALMPVKAALG